ncbi:cell division protein FtsQ/DivIB [Salinibacillus xinjiangensis]|uniref:Cell division protein DivIB n=1 Tax=Salinibacillus xinjiangensis TaxID=1229268 RepID=A0A6G1X3N2_9BACI|nr:cell division protein FtsQ/DivIB [Salinibacillus xinjiangensis]MRG85490.1 FtsQ-type POTRA domain-containing protein [Salinibacillus xinjiangensis]
MTEKKVVSIENRIPKLKEQRKKKANKRLIFYLVLFFILIMIVLYLQSPLSHVKKISVVGNQFVEHDKIVELSNITTNDNIWNLEFEKIKSQIVSHEEIKDAEIERQLPSTVVISLEEYVRVGYVKENGRFSPILENGETLDKPVDVPKGDAPILIGWENSTYLSEMTSEIRKLSPSLSQQISEIHWIPEETNPYKIRLFMSSGQEVIGSIRNFSEKMSAYPSIVSQLEPDQQGVIHIDVGTFFVPYEQEEKDEIDDQEDETSQEGEGMNETEG